MSLDDVTPEGMKLAQYISRQLNRQAAVTCIQAEAVLGARMNVVVIATSASNEGAVFIGANGPRDSQHLKAILERVAKFVDDPDQVLVINDGSVPQ